MPIEISSKISTLSMKVITFSTLFRPPCANNFLSRHVLDDNRQPMDTKVNRSSWARGPRTPTLPTHLSTHPRNSKMNALWDHGVARACQGVARTRRRRLAAKAPQQQRSAVHGQRLGHFTAFAIIAVKSAPRITWRPSRLLNGSTNWGPSRAL